MESCKKQRRYLIYNILCNSVQCVSSSTIFSKYVFPIGYKTTFLWFLGPIGSKKLPRYVEDLAEIDFTDDKQKIQFMHVLGMSFTPRKVEMGELESHEENICCENRSPYLLTFIVHLHFILSESQLSPESVVPAGPEKASEEKVPGTSISPVLVKCDKGVETEPTIIKTEFNKSDRVGAPDLTLLPLKLNKRQKSKVSDENSGWENWVKQLLDRGKAKPEPISPTIQEINGKKPIILSKLKCNGKCN